MQAASQTEKEEQALRGALPLPGSCLDCVHVKVCGIFRAIAPLMESFEDQAPFQAEDLAKICNQFFPKATIQALQSNG